MLHVWVPFRTSDPHGLHFGCRRCLANLLHLGLFLSNHFLLSQSQACTDLLDLQNHAGHTRVDTKEGPPLRNQSLSLEHQIWQIEGIRNQHSLHVSSLEKRLTAWQLLFGAICRTVRKRRTATKKSERVLCARHDEAAMGFVLLATVSLHVYDYVGWNSLRHVKR